MNGPQLRDLIDGTGFVRRGDERCDCGRHEGEHWWSSDCIEHELVSGEPASVIGLHIQPIVDLLVATEHYVHDPTGFYFDILKEKLAAVWRVGDH